MPSRRTLVPTQTVGPSSSIYRGVASSYEPVEQHQVDPTPTVDRAPSLVLVPPPRQQSQPMDVQDLAQYESRGEETLVPSVQAGTQPY